MKTWIAIAAAGTIWLAASSLAHSATFDGNECTDGCSGHKAGYDWAQQNGINDQSQCGGNSASFEEGCQSYVQDPNRGSDEDDDGNEIDGE